MLTMCCDRCGRELPLEQFEVERMRLPLYSHEAQAISRLRRAPDVICRDCFVPASDGVVAADFVLSQGDTADTRLDLELLSQVYDRVRRLLRSHDDD